MLSTSTPFPQAGADALVGGKLGRIIRVNADGSRFVTGPGLAVTVPLAELSDPHALGTGLDEWIAERLDRTPGNHTSLPALHDDYLGWCRDLGATDPINVRSIFATALVRAGVDPLGRQSDGRKYFAARILRAAVAA